MQQIAEKNLVSVVLLNISSAQTTSPVLDWKKQVDCRSTIPRSIGHHGGYSRTASLS